MVIEMGHFSHVTMNTSQYILILYSC